MRAQVNVVSVILLTGVVIGAVIFAHAWVADLLASFFTQQSGSVSISIPPDVEAVFYQNNKTCMLVRNPEDENVDVNTFAVYVRQNGVVVGAYTPSTSSCGSSIPAGGRCEVCIDFYPSSTDTSTTYTVDVGVSGGSSGSPIVLPPPPQKEPIVVFCDSCRTCTNALVNAKTWADTNGTGIIVRLVKDINVAAESGLPVGGGCPDTAPVCINLQNIDYNYPVTFDGNGHIITGGGGLFNIVTTNVRNITFTGLNIPDISEWCLSGGLTVEHSFISASGGFFVGFVGQTDLTLRDTNFYFYSGNIAVGFTDLNTTDGVNNIYVDVSEGNVLVCSSPSQSPTYSFWSGTTTTSFVVTCAGCESGSAFYYDPDFAGLPPDFTNCPCAVPSCP